MINRLPSIIRRRWPILVVLPLLGAALGWVFTPSDGGAGDVTYEATASVAVSQSLNQTEVQQRLVEVRFDAVAEETAEAVGDGATVTSVARIISSSFDSQTYVVTFTASSPDRSEADRYLEAFTTAFIRHAEGDAGGGGEDERGRAELELGLARRDLDEFIAEHREAIDGNELVPTLQMEFERLERDLNEAEQRLRDLDEQPASEQHYRLITRENARAVSSKKLELPEDRPLRMTIGLLLGAVAAAVLVAIVERMNPRVDDPERAAELVGAPVLAMIPVLGRAGVRSLERVRPEEFRGPFAEAYRSVRTHLDFRAQVEGRERPPTVLITSATPGEGKSTSVAFLAMAYAEASRSPIVIGADLRRPTIHQLFEVDRIPGLSSRATVGGSAVPLPEIVKRDPVTGVSLVPGGPVVDRVTGLVEDIDLIARTANETGRVVLLDTPPVMVANDATDFLGAADWVVLVVRAGRTTERALIRTVRALGLNRAEVAGIIMIGSAEASDATRYYSGYYDDSEIEGTQMFRERPPGEELRAIGSFDDDGG